MDETKPAGVGPALSEGLGAASEAKKRGARHTLRRLACAIGWRTTYHVAALYHQDSHVSASTLSMTVTLRPWLHADNYRALAQYLHTQATRPTPALPVITSITKLGA